MDVYFSHSYRDVPLNTYFSGLFSEAGISLRADQKTDVWCIAKLERYMFEMDGFVSIIPRRIVNDSIGYSPYIERELRLARRARAPRILFVDGQILTRYPSAFPAGAIPFFHEAPEVERARHVEMVNEFRHLLASGGARPHRQYVRKRATVIVGNEMLLQDAASHIAALLRSEHYDPSVVSPAGLDEAFDDIDVFESMLSSELCVFVLGKDLSFADVLLGMAHAHCIPSMRLRHDPENKSGDPDLSGVVRWTSPVELAPRFLKIFGNYQSAFEHAAGRVELEKLSTPTHDPTRQYPWNTSDGPGLVVHVRPDDSYASDRVNGVIREMGLTESGRLRSNLVYRSLYDRIKRDRFYYDLEPASDRMDVQMIRTPLAIETYKCGTCLDLACLFASLLEAAHERPILVVLRKANRAHALAGYFAPDGVTWDSTPALSDLRAAVRRGEAVLFEATGAVEARTGPVGAETEQERTEGGLMLDSTTAKNVATRLIEQEVELKHFVDVRNVRRSRSAGR